jgi:hypothetical protein
MEELSATRPTSLGSGAHDEGGPAYASGGEEAWTAMGLSGGPVGAGSEATRDAPSITAKGPSGATEQATPAAALVAQMGLGHPVQAQRQPRRAPPRAATIEVEEIV